MKTITRSGWTRLAVAALLPAVVLTILLAPRASDERAIASPLTFTVDSIGDAPDLDPGDGTCETAGAECTLRAAMEEANGNAGADTIHFNIAGAGVHTITPASLLPTITETVTLDATTQPGYAGTPLIELNGTDLLSSPPGGALLFGFDVYDSSAFIYGFNIHSFYNGIVVDDSSYADIQANWIGLNAAGTAAAPNDLGILVVGTASANIGSIDPAWRNVISGNSSTGITALGSSTVIQGNYIGTNPAGTAAIGNGEGIVTGAAITIGGADIRQRNVISGNSGRGVAVQGDPDIPTYASGTQILNNYIGTNATNTGAIANGSHGVEAYVANNVIVGTADAPNVIAYNGGAGVYVGGDPSMLIHSEKIAVRGNSIHDNVGLGIDLGATGANNDIAAPSIALTFPPQGTTCASCWVDVYSDSADEGKIYQGSVQATGAGAWSFYGRVDGPNITATATNASGDTSEFSATLAKPACGATCTEGFWHVDYVSNSSSLYHHCSAWTNRAGDTTAWGHMSCTDGVEFDFTNVLTPGPNTVTGATYCCGGAAIATTAGTYTATTNTGTWSCPFACVPADSGTYSAFKPVTSEVTIPAGGGTASMSLETPIITISVPVSASSPAVTVRAVPLTGTEPGRTVMRTGLDFMPNGAVWSPPVTVTVDFTPGAGVNPQHAVYNDNCTGMAMYKQDQITGTWSFEKLVDCNNQAQTFTVTVDTFSVRRFSACTAQPSFLMPTDPYDGNFVDLPGVPPYSVPYDDVTVVYSDAWRTDDSCDPDDDNDGRADVDELSGGNCAVAVGALTPTPVPPVTNPLVRDSDGDRFLDGPECDLRFNPSDPLSKPNSPTTQCVEPTQAPPFNGTPTPKPNSDPDGDGIPSWREYCNFYSDPYLRNTDRASHFINRPVGGPEAPEDPWDDHCEVANVNADRAVNVTDFAQVAKRITGGEPYHVHFDLNRDGSVNVNDLLFLQWAFAGKPSGLPIAGETPVPIPNCPFYTPTPTFTPIP